MPNSTYIITEQDRPRSGKRPEDKERGGSEDREEDRDHERSEEIRRRGKEGIGKLLKRRATIMASDLHTIAQLLRVTVVAPLSLMLPKIVRLTDELCAPGAGRKTRPTKTVLAELGKAKKELRHVETNPARLVHAGIQNVLDAYDDTCNVETAIKRLPVILESPDLFVLQIEALDTVRCIRQHIESALSVVHACRKNCPLYMDACNAAANWITIEREKYLRPGIPSSHISGVSKMYVTLRDWSSCLWDHPEGLAQTRKVLSDVRKLRRDMEEDNVPAPQASNLSCRTRFDGRVRSLVMTNSQKDGKKGFFNKFRKSSRGSSNSSRGSSNNSRGSSNSSRGSSKSSQSSN